MIPSSSQGIRCNGTDDEMKIEESFVISSAAFYLDTEIAQRMNLIRSPRNGARTVVGSRHVQDVESEAEMGKGKIEKGILVKHRRENADRPDEHDLELCDRHNKQIADVAENSQKNTDTIDSKVDMAMTEALSGDLNKEISSDLKPIRRKAVSDGQILEEVMTAEVHMEILSETHVTALQKSTCLDELDRDVKRAADEERENKIKTYYSVVPIEEILEHTAEKNLHHQNEGTLFRGYSVPLETSLAKGTSHLYPLKGKNKALSDGNEGRRFSHDVDVSQGSAESCNIAGFLGKRHLNFDRHLTGESKRFKKQMGGCPASTSMIRHDNSFRNWVSNMINGFSNSNQEEVPSLDLTVARSCHKRRSILHETIICREHQESVTRNMGFETIFRSLYCPSDKLIEARVSRDDCSFGRLQDLVLADKTNVQTFPVNFPLQKGVSFSHIFLENEKVLPASAEDVVSQSDQAWNLSAIAPIQNDFRTVSAEEKAPSSLDLCKGKNETRVSGSCNQKIAVTENDKIQVASDGGTTHDWSNRNKLFSSLWIARFSSKTSSTSLNLNHSERENSEAINCPGDCTMANPQTQTSPGLPIEQKFLDTGININQNSGDLYKELQTFSVNPEFSLGFKEIHDHKCPNFVLKLNSFLPSQGLKCPEAMNSVFARRLDALKHIIPSNERNNASCTYPTCSFCSKNGHNLPDCSEVMETELKYLLSSTSSDDRPEESPFFCIICFRHDHWAVTCPVLNSSRQQQLENKMSSCNCLNAGHQNIKEDHLKVSACSREEPFVNTDLINPMSNAEEFSGKRISCLNETWKQISLNAGESKFREQQNSPSSNLVSEQIAEVPKGMFDAVKRLQVSRADIHKWINFNVSLSRLEGLFLRLRIGKWEAGLGGTGYGVACITAGESMKDSETYISASVGGIKCLVRSQYVSNQDFLEDELMVWWSRTLKSGGKIPSTEELETKFKQRLKLGF